MKIHGAALRAPLPRSPFCIENIMTSPSVFESGSAVGTAPRKYALWILSALPILLGLAGDALAQSAPSQLPPRLERLEEGLPPTISTPKQPAPAGSSDDRPGTTDLRDNTGAVTETQVRTPVSRYTVKPNRQVGNAQPGDLQSSGNRGAQFKLGEFDLGRKKDARPAQVPPSIEGAPSSATPAKN